MKFVDEMRNQNPNAQVKICRDHCGPGFNGNYDISDTYATIEDDIKRGFDLIHVDFCHYLTVEAGVTVVPVSALYASDDIDHLVRFCFCKRDEVLDAAVHRLNAHFVKSTTGD